MILQRITNASGAGNNASMHPLFQNGHPREIIEKLRLERGFVSARALAAAAGIQQPTLARYLNGTSDTMEVESFVALAKVLEVTLSELLGEVPLSGGGRIKELLSIMEQLPEAERAALVAAGHAMVEATKPPR